VEKLMTNISQNIAQALKCLKKTDTGKTVSIFQSKEIKRKDRELLIKTHWLQEVIRGWYVLIRPDLFKGDSTAWYVNYWNFLKTYLNSRFGQNYCLSAESSLDLYVETTMIPKQIIVIVPKGGSKIYNLLYDTSLLIYEDAKNFPKEKNTINGLQVLPLTVALCKVSPHYFKSTPNNAEIALRLVKTPAELTKTIIQYNFKSAANRLIGAYQFLGKTSFANHIEEDLKVIGIITKAENPFQKTQSVLSKIKSISPIAIRIKILWVTARKQILHLFPKAPGLPKNSKKYLTSMEEIYQTDAYHSLSIEGYQITPELIEKVKTNQWKPDVNIADQDQMNALMAKGYYHAFQAVKNSVKKILRGQNAGKVLVQDLQNWYRQLFLPSTQIGLIPAEQLIGYRSDRVHICGSRHLPPPANAIVDAMEVFFDCIQQETDAATRAILGHYFFVFIHPYMDGNGRIARFIMNSLFASGGYKWTIIENKNRNRYMETLKIADETGNFKPFAKFILSEMKK
jgi:hypothetical protein